MILPEKTDEEKARELGKVLREKRKENSGGGR